MKTKPTEEQTLTKKVTINGTVITITLKSFEASHPWIAGRTETLWSATNDYGEPRNVVRGYETAAGALQAEISDLKQMFV